MAALTGPLSDELKAALKKYLEDTARDPRKIDYKDHSFMKYLMHPQIIIHNKYDFNSDRPVFVITKPAYEQHLERIIDIGWRNAIYPGVSRLTPTGQRLKWFLEDIGILSVWLKMDMTRWQTLRRTLHRWIFQESWWPRR